MMMANGLTSAITNPLEAEIKQAIMVGDVMLGNDENCADWIAAHRPPTAEGEPERDRSRRRRR